MSNLEANLRQKKGTLPTNNRLFPQIFITALKYRFIINLGCVTGITLALILLSHVTNSPSPLYHCVWSTALQHSHKIFGLVKLLTKKRVMTSLSEEAQFMDSCQRHRPLYVIVSSGLQDRQCLNKVGLIYLLTVNMLQGLHVFNLTFVAENACCLFNLNILYVHSSCQNRACSVAFGCCSCRLLPAWRSTSLTSAFLSTPSSWWLRKKKTASS